MEDYTSKITGLKAGTIITTYDVEKRVYNVHEVIQDFIRNVWIYKLLDLKGNRIVFNKSYKDADDVIKYFKEQNYKLVKIIR